MDWRVHNLTGLLEDGDDVNVRKSVEGHHWVAGVGGRWVGVLVKGSRPWGHVLGSHTLSLTSSSCSRLFVSHWFLAATRWAASAIHSCHENILLGLGPKQQSQPTLYWILWKQTPRWILSSFRILSGMLSHSEMCHTMTHNFPHDLRASQSHSFFVTVQAVFTMQAYWCLYTIKPFWVACFSWQEELT